MYVTLVARAKWMKPEGTDLPKLKLYNSLTRQKVIVVCTMTCCDDPLPTLQHNISSRCNAIHLVEKVIKF